MTSKREHIKVEKREVLGKKVKKLRREGILPANVYGKDMKSAAIQLPIVEFKALFDKVHETGLVDLEYNGDTLPVLIHNLQINPKTREPLHADFFKVNLKEKIVSMIPIKVAGEAKAVSDNVGLLEQPVQELEVEALPTDLPENIEVNVEALAAVDDQITVADIKAPAGVEILNEPSQVVFKIGELVVEEPEPEEEPSEGEEAAAEGAQTGDAVEGESEEKPAEGAPAEESQPQE